MYICDGKVEFSASLLQCDPSEIILCWFSQLSFIVIFYVHFFKR